MVQCITLENVSFTYAYQIRVRYAVAEYLGLSEIPEKLDLIAEGQKPKRRADQDKEGNSRKDGRV